jgi:hypothetical protein
MEERDSRTARYIFARYIFSTKVAASQDPMWKP